MKKKSLEYRKTITWSYGENVLNPYQRIFIKFERYGNRENKNYDEF